MKRSTRKNPHHPRGQPGPARRPHPAPRLEGTRPALRPRRACTRLVREAVADVVRKQAEAGIDIVTDGEQGKASFFGYVVERFNGFERKPAPPGQGGHARARRAASTWLSRTTTRGPSASPNGRADGAAAAATAIDICTGPVSYKGRAAVQTDIDEPQGGAEGPAPRGRLHAGHRAVLHLRDAAERVLPHRRGVRAGAGRRPPRGVPGHRRRGLHAPDRRSAPGHLLHDESRTSASRTAGSGRRSASKPSTTRSAASRPRRSAFTRATASTSARASTTWS